MRQFFKFMFASMLGTLLVGIVLIFIFIGSLVAMIGSSVSSDGKEVTIKDGSVLHLKLDEEIVDRGPKDRLDIDLGPFSAESKTGLNTVLAALEHAKTDDHIEGVFLDIGSIPTGFATLTEIRNKLNEFREESGKPVIAYSDQYGQGAYYVATAADGIYVQPKGDLMYHGLQSEQMFYKGLFQKLGVEMQFIRGSNNKFKSFGEVYTEDHMSEANKMQIHAILDGLWSEHLNGVSTRRGISRERLNTIADSLLVRNAAAAAALGMVDGLKFRDEVLDLLKERMGLDAKKDVRLVDVHKYSRSFKAGKPRNTTTKDKLAVIYAEGSIVNGKSGDGTIGGASLSETIRKARKDSTIKAIVLRVNSPGGSGLASDVIWREVKLATEVKPVVVSMGNVAASGGYYISAPATKIYADPTTITGSIGVFGIIPNMKGFFNDKLGITFDGTKTHRFADMMTVTRPLDPEEKHIIQGYIDEFYDGFKQRVAEGRNMTVEQVDSVGQGRVWTGVEAKRIGLVDELGGLEDAIAAAAELAGLEDHRTVELPEQKEFFQKFLEDLSGNAKGWVATEMLGEDAELLLQYKRAAEARKQTGIMARMPFDLIIR